MKETTQQSREPRTKSRPAPKIARSKATKWRIGFLIGVHVLFALHLAHWRATGKTMTPLEPSEAMEFSKHSVINAGFIFFALMILSTVIFGRFFCGWACHLVFVQDLCAGLMRRLGITPRPLRSRALALVPFLAAFYLFGWPFVERYMHLGIEIDPTLQLETSKFWATFPGLMIGILTFLVTGVAIVYFLGSKGFCTYACPYGAFFHVADRLAPVRILVNDDCASCGHCTVACTSNVAVAFEVRQYGMVVDPGCLKTLDCVSVCPNDALRVGLGKPSIAVKGKQRRKPRFGFGYETLMAVGFIAGFLTFRGLYGRIPFLLALGLGACLAFFLLRFVQLFTQPNVSIPPFQLKTNGHLTRAGRASQLLFLALAIFWGHSMWVRSLDLISQRTYGPLIEVRSHWMMPAPPEVPAETQEIAKSVLQRANRVLEVGLFETPRCRVERAWASMILGDTQTFMEDMAVAAALAPNDVNSVIEPAHFLRASGLQQQSRALIQESLPLYLEGARRDPDEPQTLRFLVDAANQAGQIQVAIDHLQAQAKKRDWDSVAREHLGIAFLMAGQLDGAQAAFESALERVIEPVALQGLILRIARISMESGNAPLAVSTLLLGQKRLPKDTHLTYVLAQVLFSTGDLAQALDVLDQGLQLEPQNETLQGLRDQISSKQQK